jgi:hypothetical protein
LITYDLDALKNGLVTIRSNIQAFEQALALERQKEAEYTVHIAEAERILKMHRREDVAGGSKK